MSDEKVTCRIDVSTIRKHDELVSHAAAGTEIQLRRTLGGDLLAGPNIVFVEAISDVRPLISVYG